MEYGAVPKYLTEARTAFICMYSGAFFAFWKYRGTSTNDRQINQTTAYDFLPFLP